MSGGEKRTDGIATIQWFGCMMSWKLAGQQGACCNWTHSTSSGEYNWGEGGMLYFPDALLICSLFFFFMSSVASTGCGCGNCVIGWLLCLGFAVVSIYGFVFWPGFVPQLH